MLRIVLLNDHAVLKLNVWKGSSVILGSNLESQSQCDLECKGVNENIFNLKGNFLKAVYLENKFLFTLYYYHKSPFPLKSLVQEERSMFKIRSMRHFRNSILKH